MRFLFSEKAAKTKRKYTQRPANCSKRRTRSASKPFFLVPGIWYLMINFPLICFVKSGITGGSAFDRAKQIDRAAPGIPIPIFFVVTFFHYELEQLSHRAFKNLSVSYYKGDGHTEWFWLPAGVFIFFAMVMIWVLYIWLLGVLIERDLIGLFQSLLVGK